MLVFHSIASSSTSNLLLFNKVHGRLEEPTLSELLKELIEECGELPNALLRHEYHVPIFSVSFAGSNFSFLWRGKISFLPVSQVTDEILSVVMVVVLV